MTNPNPELGDNMIKFAKATAVCCKCGTQIILSGFHDSGLPIWKCDHSACPSYGKTRNKDQWMWIEYSQAFEYRKVKLL